MPRALAALTALLLVAVGTPRARAADPLVYVSLGDSYVAGPIVLPHDTRWVPQDCGQSLRNYAHLAALALRVDEFKDVSCGGATIDDFAKPGEAYVYNDVPAQFDALNASVDAVTVGVGGNDVGFVSLALDCIRLEPPPLGDGPCAPDYKQVGVDKIEQKIAATAIELGVALDQLHQRAPNAVVLVVSYPTALPDDAVACWPYLPILPEDMPYLVEKYKHMNEMLRRVAVSHDATYVDIYTPSIGHDACKPPGLAWVNGAVLAPPSFPAHPNDLSFLNSAPIVADAIRVALAKRNAAAPITTSSTSTTTAPPATARGGLLPRTGGDDAPLLLGAAAIALAGARRKVRHA